MSDLRDATRIITRSGGWFFLADPRPEDVRIGDIAYALAGINRYTGHSRITVAQHSVMVSRLVPAPWARQGLLHDAAEAYVGDPSRPLRGLLRALGGSRLEEVEHAVWRAVAARFDVPIDLDESVRAVDTALCSDELASAFLMPPDWAWPHGEPASVVHPWDCDFAHDAFMARFAELWPEAV